MTLRSSLAAPRTKPFLKWVGGKSQLLPYIHQHLPAQIDTYLEPFLGGGAVFFSIAPKVRRAYLSDINSDLIETYRAVQLHPHALLEELQRHQTNFTTFTDPKQKEEYFYSIRNLDREPGFHNLTPEVRASRAIFLNKTCFNGLYRVNRRGEFNSPYGHYENPKILDRDTILACHETLTNTHTTLLCGTFSTTALHNETLLNPNTFVYLDPPYVPISPTANFVNYSKDGFGLKQHLELKNMVDFLTKFNVKCMISNSSADLVYELYNQYNIETVTANRNISCKGLSRNPVKEVLITNY